MFKGAANAAAAKPGPLKDFYDACVARGIREELAKVILARKISSIALRLWKNGELWDRNAIARDGSYLHSRGSRATYRAHAGNASFAERAS